VTERIDVGVLGATGTVGRCLLERLDGHPWFRLAEVGASPASTGRRLSDALGRTGEFTERKIAADILDLTLKAPDQEWRSPLIFSTLPARVARPLEEALAADGRLVVSNASSHRMDPDVPLLIPELNPEHLALLDGQRERWSGALVTNPNCSVVGLAIALAPLHRRFGLEMVCVTTLQAISGAGRPGPAAAQMLDNVLPFIAGEEEKLAHEPQKILGDVVGGRVRPAGFPVSAHVHRVPVAHGHLLAVSVKLAGDASVEEVREALSEFRGAAMDERLPSAPERPIVVVSGEARPQPRLDRDRDAGMAVSVGRIRPCQVLDVKFSVLVHNLVRGAAGAALLNAELCHFCGTTRRA
jgi:aspartate-semialdehyde dehydrogenase